MPSESEGSGKRVFPQDFVDKIICGDCLEVMKEIPDNSIDLVVTDPPYFLPIHSYVGARGKPYPKRTIEDTSILKGYFERIFEQLNRILKPNGTYYIFCDAQSYPIFYQVMFPYCKHVRLIIWDKIVSYNGYTWRHQHELIAWGELDKTKRIPTGDGDIIKCRGVMQDKRNHPAEKPIKLIKTIIEKHPEYQIIFDPYVGSGSTPIACIQENRNFIGIELNPKYCEIARKRIANVPKRLDRFVT